MRRITPDVLPRLLDLSSSRARSLALGHAATPFDVRKPGPSASNPLVTAIPLSSNSCFAGNSELREVSQGGRGRA